MVYVLDGLLYSLTHWPKLLVDNTHATPTTIDRDNLQTTPTSNVHACSCITLTSDESNTQNDRLSESNKKQKLEPNGTEKLIPTSTVAGSRFFKRTESVIAPDDSNESSTEISNVQFFGVEGGASLALKNPELVGPPNPWETPEGSFLCPINATFPLANQPHLLNPFAKKDVLFRAKYNLMNDGAESGGGVTVSGDMCESAGCGKDGQGKGKRGKKRKLPHDLVDR